MSPPRLARALVHVLLNAEHREFFLGDLEEEYALVVEERGVRAARRWYWRQTARIIGSGLPLPRRAGPRPPRRQGEPIMMSIAQDLRYATRVLRKQPGFACLVMFTLALAIGANTVIFSFVNVLLLRPLPVSQPETLAWIYFADTRRGETKAQSSIPDIADWRAGVPSFAALAGFTLGSYTLTGRADALRVEAIRTTANLFDVWGVTPAMGRTFAADEDRPGAPAVVLVSDHFWRRQLDADPAVLGQSLVLNGRPHTIIGVLKRDIEFGNLALADVWTPMLFDPHAAARDDRSVQPVGRLAPHATLQQADAEVRSVFARILRDHPSTSEGLQPRVAPTSDAVAGGDTWIALSLLGVFVSAVLAIACANLANVVLARALGRQRELAMRTALGASRFRLVRQMVTENLLLAIGGGILGLAVAGIGLRVIRAAAYEPIFELVVIDHRVLVFAAALGLSTPFLFSLLPALHSSRASIGALLKETGVRGGGGRLMRRGRSVLVVGQVALALMLLVVAGLVLRTMVELTRVDTGFDPHNLLTFQVDAPSWKYSGDERTVTFYDQMIEALHTRPGVGSVSAASALPVLGNEVIARLALQDQPARKSGEDTWAVMTKITPAFFVTTKIPVIAGRVFTRSDRRDAPEVVIVNREMARRHWGAPDLAVGRRLAVIRPGGPLRWLEVVGVSGNTERRDLDGTVNPQIYVPFAQSPQTTMSLMVRTTDPAGTASVVRETIRAVDGDLAAYDMRTFEQGFRDRLASSRIVYGMFAAFALVALGLASAGLYGVIAYSVSQRGHEIGVRLALGADPRAIGRMILRQSAMLAGLGLAIGLVGAFVLARISAGLLFRVSPSDGPTYAVVLTILVVVSLVAAYVPARRAMRIDPIQALRVE